MRQTDVAIIGGGLGGSMTAAMLGKAGIDAILIDPHQAYPAEFRCEKLDGAQVEILKKTGLAEGVLRASTPDRESWVARFGVLVDKRPGDQQGIMYAPLVNTVRGLIPDNVTVVYAKATGIATGAERQRVTLSTGEEIDARLVVLANGLSVGLRDQLGLSREVLSEGHSTSIGFDMIPVGRRAFPFPALSYYADRIADRTAVLTMFPIGAAMRANLFTYRDMKDSWLREFRAAPRETLFALMPGLRKLTGDFTVEGRINIRPIDLYVTHGHHQAGVVLIGDAFATSCPAAGAGARKVLTDVERLCNVHIPHWLATPGMAADKIAAFYDDPVKRACDDFAFAKSFDMRAFSIAPSPRWYLRRWATFVLHFAFGSIGRIRRHWAARPAPGEAMAARTKTGLL